MPDELFAYKIAGVDNGNPILDFGQVQVSIVTMPYLLQIFFIEVFPGEPHRHEPVWGFLAANLNPLNLPKITRLKYGDVPAGYELRQEAEPLEKGSYYSIGVSKLILHKIGDDKFETIHRDDFDKLPKPAVPKEPRVQDFSPQGFAGEILEQNVDGEEDESDYHSPSRKKASPRALELMKDEYFWSCADEASPFGSDEGADLYNKYMGLATALDKPDGVEFLRMMCESWELQPGSLADLEVRAVDDPSVLAPEILAEAAAFREGIPSVDSMDLQMAALGMPPEILEMMKSTGAMSDVLVGHTVRDIFAMALAFAQLVRFGEVQPRVLDYAMMAAKVRLAPRTSKERQASPIVLERIKQWQIIFEKLKSEKS